VEQARRHVGGDKIRLHLVEGANAKEKQTKSGAALETVAKMEFPTSGPLGIALTPVETPHRSGTGRVHSPQAAPTIQLNVLQNARRNWIRQPTVTQDAAHMLAS